LKPARANSSTRPYLKKPFTKMGLVEWLKAKALSSSPITEKKEKKGDDCGGWVCSSETEDCLACRRPRVQRVVIKEQFRAWPTSGSCL
jgi:hypothetical protein